MPLFLQTQYNYLVIILGNCQWHIIHKKEGSQENVYTGLKFVKFNQELTSGWIIVVWIVILFGLSQDDNGIGLCSITWILHSHLKWDGFTFLVRSPNVIIFKQERHLKPRVANANVHSSSNICHLWLCILKHHKKISLSQGHREVLSSMCGASYSR